MSGLDQSLLAAPTANPRAGKAVSGDRGSASGRPSGETAGFNEVLAKTGQGTSGANPKDDETSAKATGAPAKPLIDIRFQKAETAETGEDAQAADTSDQPLENTGARKGKTAQNRPAAVAGERGALAQPTTTQPSTTLPGSESVLTSAAEPEGEGAASATRPVIHKARNTAESPESLQDNVADTVQTVAVDKAAGSAKTANRAQAGGTVHARGAAKTDTADDAAPLARTSDERVHQTLARLVGVVTGKDETGMRSDDAKPVAEPADDASAAPLGQLFDLLGMAGEGVSALQGKKMGDGPANAAADGLDALAKPAAAMHAHGHDAVAGLGAEGGGADDALAGEADDNGKDRLFRFARADGTGEALTMRIGGDGKGDVDAKETAKAEPVVVLDSRRYLGVALPANAQAVTNAIAASMDGQTSLMSSTVLSNPDAWTSAGKVLHTLKIQLNPVDLGAVTATMRLKDNELQVELRVTSGEALRQLTGDQDAMVRALRDQGFGVDQITVVLSQSTDTSSGGQGNGQGSGQTNSGAGQTAGDQQARQQASGDRARDERRQGGHDGAAGGDWRMNNASEGLAAAGDRIRTDDVYI